LIPLFCCLVFRALAAIAAWVDRLSLRLHDQLKIPGIDNLKGLAQLRHNPCLEDIDYRSPRGLDKALIQHRT